jgi:hypothetical protein
MSRTFSRSMMTTLTLRRYEVFTVILALLWWGWVILTLWSRKNLVDTRVRIKWEMMFLLSNSGLSRIRLWLNFANRLRSFLLVACNRVIQDSNYCKNQQNVNGYISALIHVHKSTLIFIFAIFDCGLTFTVWIWLFRILVLIIIGRGLEPGFSGTGTFIWNSWKIFIECPYQQALDNKTVLFRSCSVQRST